MGVAVACYDKSWLFAAINIKSKTNMWRLIGLLIDHDWLIYVGKIYDWLFVGAYLLIRSVFDAFTDILTRVSIPRCGALHPPGHAN